MTLAAIPAREYPEPAAPWLSSSRVRFVLILLLVAAFYSASWKLAHVDPGKLTTGLPKMAGWAKKAWPPATDELPVLLLRTTETVAMAAIGTTAATLLALPLCIVAARNVTPSMLLYYPGAGSSTRYAVSTRSASSTGPMRAPISSRVGSSAWPSRARWRRRQR